MTWSNFAYLFLHAARDAGAGSITASDTVGSSNPVDFLIDNRAGSLFMFESSGSGRYITIDRGAGSLDGIDKIIVPVGHNMSGATFNLDADDTSGFTSPTNLVTSSAITSAMINVDFTSNMEQYVRFSINGAGQWEIPELVLTEVRTPSIGVEQGWTDYLRHNTLEFTKSSGVVAALALGSDRRYFEVQYRGVDNTSDLAIFDELIATCGTSTPFYILPAYESNTPLWVKMSEDSVQTQEELVPATTDNETKHIRLSMLEHLA